MYWSSRSTFYYWNECNYAKIIISLAIRRFDEARATESLFFAIQKYVPLSLAVALVMVSWYFSTLWLSESMPSSLLQVIIDTVPVTLHLNVADFPSSITSVSGCMSTFKVCLGPATTRNDLLDKTETLLQYWHESWLTLCKKYHTTKAFCKDASLVGYLRKGHLHFRSLQNPQLTGCQRWP